MKKIFLLLFVVFSFSGCEKDDICDAATATTPRLVIQFYKYSAIVPTLNPVTKLMITGDGMTGNPLNTFDNVSSIKIPLKTTADITKYTFTLNSGTATEVSDVLQFNYTRDTVFVSRACGFKTLFNLTNTNTDILQTPNNWVKAIVIVKPNLETENETHIKIYF